MLARIFSPATRGAIDSAARGSHPRVRMTITFEEFRSDAMARGFDEALERHWEPGQVVAEHRHPFSAAALVVEGEMWLTDAEGTRHLLPGDTFTLEAQTPHDERYGPNGATYWVARKG